MVLNVCLMVKQGNVCSEIMIDKWKHVGVAFFKQNGSYNMWSFGALREQHPVLFWQTFKHFSNFAKSDSSLTSVRVSGRPSVPLLMEPIVSTGRIFMKFDICVFFENLSRKFKFHYNLTRITGTLHEDRYTSFYLTEFFLEWVIFQTKVIENQNPNFVLNKIFTKSLRLWDNVERYCTDGRTQITIRLIGMLDT
jgi:hypothetical protein